MPIVAIALAAAALVLAIGLSSVLWSQLAKLRTDLKAAYDRLDNADRIVQTLTTQVVGLHQALETTRSAEPSVSKGLIVGELAPDFALPDVRGVIRGPDDFAGHPFLAIFFDTGCGFCQRMAPRLGRLPENGPRVLIIGRGEPEAYQDLAAQFGWTCDIVVDVGAETLNAYRAGGTPAGYLVDESRRIASELASGEESLVKLYGLARSTPSQPVSVVRPIDPILARSNGLRHNSTGAEIPEVQRTGRVFVGAQAPAFVLEDLSGNQRSLSEWNDRNVLLLFVEAGWPAHDEVVSRVAQPNLGLSIIIVVEDGSDDDRKRIGQLASNHPVLVDNHWHVARLFDVSATPTAIVIGRGMRIASAAALGAEAVLRLPDQVSLS